MKKLVKILAVLVVLLVIALIAFVIFIDKAVKIGVETVGPKVTQTDVKLDSVSISIRSMKLGGLVVGNPQGYKMPHALQLGSVAVDVNPMSVFGEKIVVKSIKVLAPEITLEGGLKDNNLTKLLENIQATAAAVAPAPTDKKDAPEAKAPAQPGKKLQVDDFLISGAKVHLKMDLLAGKEMTVNLPDIHLKDLGKSEGGITPAELTSRVFKELLGSTTTAVTSAIANVGKVVGDAAKGATEGVKKATKGIGDLFKKK
ncbi:MAG: hypothetical protein HZA89_16495 [Verrucomicrobia bacterium]|nr:hypothetical protein [Verrucomicrobiota bacterium]